MVVISRKTGGIEGFANRLVISLRSSSKEEKEEEEEENPKKQPKGE